MTDQQAAAEKYVEQYEATMTLGWGDDTAYAFAKAVVALSARLAQAEQEVNEVGKWLGATNVPVDVIAAVERIAAVLGDTDG